MGPAYSGLAKGVQNGYIEEMDLFYYLDEMKRAAWADFWRGVVIALMVGAVVGLVFVAL